MKDDFQIAPSQRELENSLGVSSDLAYLMKLASKLAQGDTRASKGIHTEQFRWTLDNAFALFSIKGIGQPDGAYLALEMIYIKPAARNNGIGTDMIEQILEHADEMDLQVDIDINPFDSPLPRDEAMKRLCSFYEKFGFVVTDEGDEELPAFAYRDRLSERANFAPTP